MALESVDSRFSVYQVSGFPSFVEAERIEEEMLAEAGVDQTPRVANRRTSPTTFHVATDGRGAPLGVASSTVGPLAELPLGTALAAAGIDVSPGHLLPDPACELVSFSVDGDLVSQEHVVGVSEALYRSFYRRAKQSQARSAVVGLDPWLFDVITERYGVPFQLLGPPIAMLGRELLAAGGALDELEAGVAVASPQFATYLALPYRIGSDEIGATGAASGSIASAGNTPGAPESPNA